MGRDVIIACDFPGREPTLDFLSGFKNEKPFVKIGMELFYSEGPDIVRRIKDMGHRIFLDLKLCDIPNTVKGGMRSLAGLGADMLNVHASGGSDMMKAAVDGLTGPDGKRPILIAVTVLTSISEDRLKDELLVGRGLGETVARYAELARSSGLDGVVCSPFEAAGVHNRCGSGFLTVTPGIRFADGDRGDQARVATPAAAKAEGADYIVVGRAVTAAADPVAAYERCVAEFREEG
ncbi:MAG: orotidine-5'-phosphate decarboxylase [Clostridia bacterium]|nr:orotidine-5'-phosphate decarboxylase [Clostridia bacterium]